MSDFSEAGFLTEDLSAWRDKAWSEERQRLGFSYEINRLAMEMVPELSAESTETTLYARGSFLKALQAFQNAVFLCERGAIAEAKTVGRMCTESVIATVAFLRVSDALQRFKNDSNHHFLKLANIRLADDDLDQETRAKAELMVAETKKFTGVQKPAPLDLRKLAEDAGVIRLYNLSYRYPSGDSAHSTLIAFRQHIHLDHAAKTHTLVFQPSTRSLKITLTNLHITMLTLLRCRWPDGTLARFKDRVEALNQGWGSGGYIEEDWLGWRWD